MLVKNFNRFALRLSLFSLLAGACLPYSPALAQSLSPPESDPVPESELSPEQIQQGFAFGKMMITPSKIELLAGGAPGSFFVLNQSSHDRDFRIAVDALGDGDAAYQDAAMMIRFGPRQFSLQPGESQLVRVSANLVAALDDSDNPLPLRSRLRIRLLPQTQPLGDSTDNATSFQAIGIYSVSIPIDVMY